MMHVEDTILSAAAEAVIGENWCLLDNQSKWNTFINERYITNITNAPVIKYLYVHCNTGVTYTKTIGDIPGYSNPV